MNIQSIIIRTNNDLEYVFTGSDIVDAEVVARLDGSQRFDKPMSHRLMEYNITLTIKATSGVVHATGMGGPDMLPPGARRQLPKGIQPPD